MSFCLTLPASSTLTKYNNYVSAGDEEAGGRVTSANWRSITIVAINKEEHARLCEWVSDEDL